MTNDKIAIFGANGYLGAHLCKRFIDNGISFDRFNATLSSGQMDSIDFTAYSDVVIFTDKEGAEKSFCEWEAFVEANELFLLRILDRLVHLGRRAPRIILESSRLVYAAAALVDEKSPLEARSVYAASKIASESILHAYYCRYGIRYVVTRICVPYGNLVGKTNVYGTLGFFTKQARNGEAVTVYGDGGLSRTFTFVGDICEIMCRILATDALGIFNIGGHDYMLEEVAKIVANEFNVSVANIPWPEGAMRIETGSVSFNANKLDKLIGHYDYARIEERVKEL